jgi:hypothetical protein
MEIAWDRFRLAGFFTAIERGSLAMKTYIIGAICVWLICGIVGAVLLGQQRVDVPTIASGPIALWKGFNKPVDE